jgi:dihydroorotate dehydrogenase
MPNNLHGGGHVIEQLYVDILNGVKQKVSIPISIKLSHHFTNIPALANRLYGRDAKGVILLAVFIHLILISTQ